MKKYCAFATSFLVVYSLFVVLFLSLAHLYTIAQVQITAKDSEQERRIITAQKIDSIVVWEYIAKNNTLDKRGRIHSVTKYNRNGNIIREWQFLSPQTVTGTEYRYDTAMRLAEEYPITRSAPVGASAAVYRWQYHYDAEGRMAEAHYLTPTGETAQKKTFRYRTPTQEAKDIPSKIPKELPAEITFYRTPNRIGYREVFSFQEVSGLPTQKTRYRADNTVEQREEYRYDAQRRLTEILLYSEMSLSEPSGMLVSRKLYTYDRQGNVLEETETSIGISSVSKLVHRYDQTGLRLETQYFWSTKPPLRLTSVRKYLYGRYGD